MVDGSFSTKTPWMGESNVSGDSLPVTTRYEVTRGLLEMFHDEVDNRMNDSEFSGPLNE